MDPAQNIQSEENRLRTIADLSILNTPNEEKYDRISRLASIVFSVPIAGIGVIDRDKIWYKSKVGLDKTQSMRAFSFEEKILIANDKLVILNSIDEGYSRNELVNSGPKILFYAGFPLRSESGEIVAVFFIADVVTRRFSENDMNILEDLALWAQIEIQKGDMSFEKAKYELQSKTKEVEEERAKLMAMLEDIGDGIVGVNDKGEITFTNRQALVMSGYDESDLMGKPLIHAIKMVDEKDNEILPTSRPVRNALYLNKKIQSNDLYYVKKDGSKFAVSITATPIVLYGKVVGGVDVFRDITKEHDIDRMKTEFISLASHQLRTPLSAMKWFSEMLIDGDLGKLNEEQLEVMNNIYQSNERIIQLVNTLLNISRIESGRIIIDPQLTNLRVLIQEVVTELGPKMNEKQQKLAISVHEDLPEINIDAKLVRHVYINLLTNAMKYSPNGSEIVVMVSKSGNEVISQIADSGYGIPLDQQDKVFSKFFRAANIAKKETDGTGLGLYLTKAIVDSSGGKIWFKSEEGKGTTFWFILPLRGSQKREGEVSLDS